MARVKGTGNDISFTADSDSVEQVWPSGAVSGYVGKPTMFGIHSIECPPLTKYFSLLWDYLFRSQDASVQYLRAGKRRGQSVPEQVWAWGMGRPASKHTTHNEQTGYASQSRAQWAGDPAAVGTYFTQPSGVQMLYTEEMAQTMRDQMQGLAEDYADWCKRYGYTPHLGDQDEILRGCDGEPVGCAFFHYQASKLPNTTTNHSDPGEGRYPEDIFIQKALDAFNGSVPTSTPVKPTPPAPKPVPVKDEFDMADIKDLQKVVADAVAPLQKQLDDVRAQLAVAKGAEPVGAQISHLWDWTSNEQTGIAYRVKAIARALKVGDAADPAAVKK